MQENAHAGMEIALQSLVINQNKSMRVSFGEVCPGATIPACLPSRSLASPVQPCGFLSGKAALYSPTNCRPVHIERLDLSRVQAGGGQAAGRQAEILTGADGLTLILILGQLLGGREGRRAAGRAGEVALLDALRERSRLWVGSA